MTGRGWIGYIVWGGLAYGLTKAVLDSAAWFGMRITNGVASGVAESVLYVVMLWVAAWLLLQLYEDSEKNGSCNG